MVVWYIQFTLLEVIKKKVKEKHFLFMEEMQIQPEGFSPKSYF